MHKHHQNRKLLLNISDFQELLQTYWRQLPVANNPQKLHKRVGRAEARNHQMLERMLDFGHEGSIIGFNNLSGLNSLTNLILNKILK
jgi:hypothetical protein